MVTAELVTQIVELGWKISEEVSVATMHGRCRDQTSASAVQLGWLIAGDAQRSGVDFPSSCQLAHSFRRGMLELRPWVAASATWQR